MKKNNPMFNIEVRKKVSESNKGKKHTEETKELLRQRMTGRILTDEWKGKIGKANKGNKPWNTGKHLSDKIKQKISDAQYGEKSYQWKGGIDIGTWHDKAWEMFGKNKCDICGITLEEYQNKFNCRFDMHCTSNPKDYSIMCSDNWLCLCRSCHLILEHDLKYKK